VPIRLTQCKSKPNSLPVPLQAVKDRRDAAPRSRTRAEVNGVFVDIVGEPGHRWDTSDLYTTGEVTLLAVPEPSTMVLLLSFLSMAVVALRLRRVS
jgi:hypothetical protein